MPYCHLEIPFPPQRSPDKSTADQDSLADEDVEESVLSNSPVFDRDDISSFGENECRHSDAVASPEARSPVSSEPTSSPMRNQSSVTPQNRYLDEATSPTGVGSPLLSPTGEDDNMLPLVSNSGSVEQVAEDEGVNHDEVSGLDMSALRDPRDEAVSTSFATEMLEVVRRTSQRYSRERSGDHVPVRMRPRMFNDSDDDDERGKMEMIMLPPVAASPDDMDVSSESGASDTDDLSSTATGDSQPMIRGADVAAMFSAGSLLGNGGMLDDFEDDVPLSFSSKVDGCSLLGQVGNWCMRVTIVVHAYHMPS